MAASKKKGQAEGKKLALRFEIDCKEPVEDEVLVLRDFEKYLKERVKVDGKKGNFGGNIQLVADSNKVTLSSSVPFSKRYLKYLTKKYLKKVKIADYLRVVATDKHTYQVRYLKIHSEEGEEEAS
jgi:large subunit ribosomal protein L22e